MKGRPSYNNFSHGELDPRLQARTDLAEYHSSVKTLKNLIGTVQGPAISRGGTRFVYAINPLLPHPSAKFLKQIRTDYESLGLLYRYTTGPSDNAALNYVTPAGGIGNEQYAITDQLLMDIDNANITLSPDDDSGGIRQEPGVVQLYNNYNDGTSTTQSVQFDATAVHPVIEEWIFTVRFKEIINNPDITVTVSVTEVVAATPAVLESVEVTGTNTCRIYVTGADVTATDLYLTISLESEVQAEVSIVSINQERGSADSDILVAADCPTDVKAVRSTVDISSGRGIWMHPTVYPQQHYWDTTTFTNANVGFTNKPAEWTGSNYPTICAFYKGRSWWSGCPDNPTQIWASRVNTAHSGDWFDMTTGALDTDAISIVRNKPGRITNIVASASLLVTTEVDSFRLEAEAGVLTPSDIHEVLQAGVGAATIDPINLGAVILYVASDRRSIMATRFHDDINAWRDLHVNSHAMHLFRDKEISNIAYINNDIQNVFVVFVDGTMVIGTKDPYSEVFSWGEMGLPLYISDIASFYRAGQEHLFLYAHSPVDADIAAVLIYEPEYQLDCIQEYQAETGFNSFTTNLPASSNKLFYDSLYNAANYFMENISSDVSFRIATSNWVVVTGTDQTEYVDFDVDEILIRESGTWVEDFQPAYMLITFVAETGATIRVAGSSETIYLAWKATGSHIIPLDWTSITEDIEDLYLVANGADELGGLGDCTTDWCNNKGTGWSYDSTNNEYDSDGSQTGVSYLYDTDGNYCTIGVTYEVTFTVRNRSAGGVRVILGGGGYGTYRTANGTFTENITCAGVTQRVLFDANADFIGSITNITVRELETGEVLSQLAFGDSYAELLRIQQFYRMKLDSDLSTTWSYMGAGPFNVPESFNFSSTNTNHLITGCGFNQELETLQPYLLSQSGTGRATIKSINKVHVGLRKSNAVYIEDILGATDVYNIVDSTTSNAEIEEGYVRRALTGHSRRLTVRVNQYEPVRMEITEIILDLEQSEDG